MLNSRDYQGRPLLTELQTRAQFSLWSVLAAPLIISGSILRMSNETLTTYTNTEVIAASQDPLGKAGERVAGGNVAPIDDGLPFNGPAAIGAPCVPGRAAQNWTFLTVGGFTNRLRNAGGNCTNVASGAPNGMLDVEGYCGNGTNLGFRLSADGLLQSDLQAKGQWTLCASVRPSDRWVQMGPCSGAGVTRWVHTAAGQLRAKGAGSTELCLDWAAHTLLPQQATNVWARPLSAAAGGSAHAITFLNVASTPRVVTCDSACFGAMGYPNTSTPLPVLHARDLWAHKNLPDIHGLTFSAGSLKPNGGHRMIKVWSHKSDDEKDAVNVRSFGAVGDGRSDDSSAFSRAIAAAAEASSAVFVPAGEFVVCNITVKAGVAVRGVGAASLIRTPPHSSDCVTRSSRGRKSGVLLELESHTSLANLRFLAVNSSALHAGDTSVGQGRRAVETSVADILVQNCSFDGGGSSGPAAIHFERLAGPYSIQDNEIHGFASATSLENAPNGLVARNVVRNCSRHGIVFSGATAECDYCWPNFTQYAIWNLSFTNNSVYGQAGGSIWGSAGVGIAMVGNTIYGKGDVGLDFENCRDSVIRGNRVSGRFNAGVAVFLSSINISVESNVVKMAVPRDQKCNVDAPDCEGCSPCDGVWVTPFNPVRGAHHVPRITWTHKDIAVSHNTISVDRMLPQEEGGLSRGAGIGIDSGRNVQLEKNVLLQNATLQVYEPSKLVISPVKSDDVQLQGWSRGTVAATVTVDAEFKRYSVSVGGEEWLAGSEIAMRCGGVRYSSRSGSLTPIARAKQSTGSHPTLGPYDQFARTWKAGSCTSMETAVRFFTSTGSHEFVTTIAQAAEGTALAAFSQKLWKFPSTLPLNSSTEFPAFELPQRGSHPALGFATWPYMERDPQIQPPIDGGSAGFDSLSSGLAAGPVVIFGSGRPRPQAVALAPTQSFDSAQLSRAGGKLVGGVHGLINALPRGFTVSFALVGHREGINGAMWTLGSIMLQRGNTTHSRLSLADDPISSTLHFETDAGSCYCYCHYNPKAAKPFPMGPVVRELKAYHESLGLTMSLYHFDPYWWSVDEKAGRCVPYNLADTYSPSPYHFPEGLGALNVSTFLLFKYQTANILKTAPPGCTMEGMSVSGSCSLAFWRQVFQSLYTTSGMRALVWDGLPAVRQSSANRVNNTAEQPLYVKGFHDAAWELKLPIRFDQQDPSDTLAITTHPAITTGIVTTDMCPKPGAHVDGQTAQVASSSIFYSAFGQRPFVSSLWTTTPQPGNPYEFGCRVDSGPHCGQRLNIRHDLMLAVLTTGPVGIGDLIHRTDPRLLSKATRPDGRIIKPCFAGLSDLLARPEGLDQVIVAVTGPAGGIDPRTDARANSRANLSAPGLWTQLILATDVSSNASTLTLSSLWPTPEPQTRFIVALVEDSRSIEGGMDPCAHGSKARSCFQLWDSTRSLNVSTGARADPDWRSYRLLVAAPVLRSGWALLGDLHRYAPVSPQRFVASSEHGAPRHDDFATSSASGFTVDVLGVAGERLNVTLVAPAAAADEGPLDGMVVVIEVSMGDATRRTLACDVGASGPACAVTPFPSFKNAHWSASTAHRRSRTSILVRSLKSDDDSAVSPLTGPGCATDMDCSLNGICSLTGVCRCEQPWSGPTCGELTFRPATRPGAAYGFSPNVTSWGGSPVAAGGQWHLFVSEIAGKGCGLTKWEAQSRVAHATAPSVMGPYKKQDVALAVEAHNPHVLAFQGEYLLFHIGSAASTHPIENCTARTSDFVQTAATSSAGALIHRSHSLNGPWVPAATTMPGPCVNPAPWLLKNGSLAVVCSGADLHNRTWHLLVSDAAGLTGKWTSRPIFPGVSPPTVRPHKFWEDPVLFMDARNHWHILAHCYVPHYDASNDYVSGHLFSQDGLTWKESAVEPYRHSVMFTGDVVQNFSTLERPKLAVDASSRLTHLFNGVSPRWPCAPCGGCTSCKVTPGTDWTYTLVRELL